MIVPYTETFDPLVSSPDPPPKGGKGLGTLVLILGSLVPRPPLDLPAFNVARKKRDLRATLKAGRSRGGLGTRLDSWFCKLNNHMIICIGLYWSTCSHVMVRTTKKRPPMSPDPFLACVMGSGNETIDPHKIKF